MTRYRLHYFPESGNSYKLALMLTLCGETFEGVWTDFGGGGATAGSEARPTPSASRSCAGCSGTTTSSPATWRPTATTAPSHGRPIRPSWAFMRRRIDDYLGILDAHLRERPFAIGDTPTIADISMMAYLSFPKHEAGYDFAQSHPAVAAWLARMAELPDWQAPYDLLPGQRLHCYV